jgi:5-methylthioadenosine/S-adenosylhomocysteine deaminase
MSRAGVSILLAGWLAAACRPGPEAAPPAAGAPAMDAPETLLLTASWVVTMDAASTVLEDGAVAIDGGRIVAVGPAAELAAAHPAARRLDAAGKVLLPGLVNGHTHVPMTLLRGLADDLPLMTWLEDEIFPAEARWVDEEFVRWGTRLACLEMIRGGVTTFVDMYYFEDAIAEEAARCGLRAVVGETLIDFPAPDNKTWDDALAYTEAFLARWRGHPLITAAVAPHAAYTVSAEHLQAAHRLAERFDAPYLIHVAENRAENDRVRQRYGTTTIGFLDRLGVLDGRMIAAHVVVPEDAEIGLLAARGVGVAHCPQSNMKIASGIAPVPRMLAAGVAVGLGTDGAASNNDLDLWEEIDTAAKLHKVALLDATVLDAREALEMATLGGARAIHMADEIGSLEVGKRADLIAVDVSGAHTRPFYDLYSLLTYTVKAADVDTVIVDGKVLLEGGEVLTVDAAAVLARADDYRDRIRGGSGG